VHVCNLSQCKLDLAESAGGEEFLAANIRIIGIDPGLRRTGWGIVESDGVRFRYIASGVLQSNSSLELSNRLVSIYEGLLEVVRAHRPFEAAVEETFVNRDARATLKLGQARGIAVLVPAIEGLWVSEYAPNLVKKTVTGSGHAEKGQIRAMLKVLLPLAKPQSEDEADALAIAICHANHRNSKALSARLSEQASKRVLA